MVASILALLTKVLDIFWPSKTAEKVATDDGVISGQSLQKAADQQATINSQSEVIRAQQDMASVPPISDSDALQRLRDGRA